MKKYTYISIIALLSGVFLMQPMESGKSSAESLARESKKDDTGSVVYGGSSSDSDDDGLDGALLQRKNLRYKIPLGIPSRRLSAAGATQEPLKRRGEWDDAPDRADSPIATTVSPKKSLLTVPESEDSSDSEESGDFF